jgi:hypothetical protein
VAGNENTYGGEGVVTALYDRYSVSAGAFGYRTDGWRDNNDIKQDVEDVYFQSAITPELNAQAEFRRRHSDEGDLRFNFDPDFFDEDFHLDTDQDNYRAGLRYSPLPSTDFLLSFMYSDLIQKLEDVDPLPLGPPFGTPDLVTRVRNRDEGYQIEGQNIYRRDWLNLTTGFAYAGVDRRRETFLSVQPFIPGDEDVTKSEIEHPRGYVYANVNLPDPVTWTLGVSYDHYENQANKVDKVNPKFGVEWNVTDDLVVRGAVFRYVKPALVNNQTLEPTQIAGFNQLFDDANATAYWRYGVGVDHRLWDNVFIGSEATWRELSNPRFTNSQLTERDLDNSDEQTHRAYVNWLPIPELALSLEFVYDKFSAQKRRANTALVGIPEKVTTYSVPVGARYFHPSGAFAGFSVTYVNQDVNYSEAFQQLTGQPDGSADFFYLDAAVGYRLPKRFGIISLGVTNLLDKSFKYQDDNYREFEDQPSIGPYFPERLFFGQLTMNF